MEASEDQTDIMEPHLDYYTLEEDFSTSLFELDVFPHPKDP